MANVSGLGIVYSLLIMQIFYGAAVTLIVAVLPLSGAQMAWFNDPSGVMSFTTTASAIESGLNNTTQIPLLDFGALVFYSSNLLFNLIVNIVFAVPFMLTTFLDIFFYFLPIDYSLQVIVKLIFIPVVSILYYFVLLTWLTGTRVQTQGGGWMSLEWLWNFIDAVMAGNGLTFEFFVFLLVFFMGLIFCIQDYRIGFMALLILSIEEFVFMYLLGFTWIFALFSLVLSVLLMSFAIFSNRQGDAGMVA